MTDLETADDDVDSTENPVDEVRSRFFATAMAFELGLAALAMAIGWLVGFNPLAGTVGIPTTPQSAGWAALWGIAGAVPMVAAFFFFDRYPIGPLKGLKELTERLVLPLFSSLAWWQLLLLSIAAGVGEETLFRGLVQAGLANLLPLANREWIGCTVAATLFGFCHWLSATYGILAIVIGVYLGGLFILTDSLVAPITAHALYDFVALMYFVRRKVEA